MNQVTVSLTVDEVVKKIQDILDNIYDQNSFNGQSASAAKAQEIYNSIGNGLLHRIHSAFIQKSNGGTGDDGISWEPITQETAKRRAKKKTMAPKFKDTEFYDKWREVFSKVKFNLIRNGLGEAEAEQQAGRLAWAAVKNEGYERQVSPADNRILVESGELMDSLKPNSDFTQRPTGPATVFNVSPGLVEVGTTEKPFHHRKRPFWPETIPDVWMDDILHDVCVSIVDVIQEELQGQ